jgi:hypothetical protein
LARPSSFEYDAPEAAEEAMNRADTTGERTAGNAKRPEIRAAQLKEDLAALDELGPERASRVRARLRPETLTAIGEAPRHEWSPMELYLELARAIANLLGDDVLRSWAARSVARATEAPLLAPILTAAVDLFGLTPAGLVRRTSVVWSAVFRNCGELRVLTCDRQQVTLELGPLPPSIRSTTLASRGPSEPSTSCAARRVTSGSTGERRTATSRDSR